MWVQMGVQIGSKSGSSKGSRLRSPFFVLNPDKLLFTDLSKPQLLLDLMDQIQCIVFLSEDIITAHVNHKSCKYAWCNFCVIDIMELSNDGSNTEDNVK